MAKFLIELDSDEMARRGRLGALKLHATHDPKETTKAARAAFRSKFEREVDPHGVLPEAERQRRAEYARREFYTRMAHKSAEVRRQKKRQSAGA
jgi:hypothetical protein